MVAAGQRNRASRRSSKRTARAAAVGSAWRQVFAEIQAIDWHLEHVGARRPTVQRMGQTQDVFDTQVVARRPIVERRKPAQPWSITGYYRGVDEERHIGRGQWHRPLGNRLMRREYGDLVSPALGDPVRDTPAGSVIAAQRIAEPGDDDARDHAGRAGRTNSSSSAPSAPNSCTRMGIWPTACVEHDRHGS